MSIIWRRLRYMLCPQADMYLHLVPLVHDKTVLEVGFGTGFGVLQYAVAADKIDAIETDRDAVNWALESVPLANVRWLLRDITAGPMDRQYDVVVAFEVLEHIDRWQAALCNIGRALAPGGVAYISRPNANADLRKNANHVEEWSAGRFAYELSVYFNRVELVDYTLVNRIGFDTTVTPMVARVSQYKARQYAMPNLVAKSYSSVDDAAKDVLNKDFDVMRKYINELFYGPTE